MIENDTDRSLIANMIGDTVDAICRKHARRRTQEPAITARIGQALEELASNMSSRDLRIDITVQDIPDRGPNALEKISGIDVYVNISVTINGRTKRKALLIQAKRKGKRDRNIIEQCEKMLQRSPSSYAWIYGDDAAEVVNAADIVSMYDYHLDQVVTRRTSELFDSVLECFEGDPTISMQDVIDPDVGLENILRRLSAPTGVNFSIVL